MEESNTRLERLQDLEGVEKKIVELLQNAGQSLNELSKDKPVAKNVENAGNSFVRLLKSIDETLSQQILHLSQISTGASHEGTHYDVSKERETTSRCIMDLESQIQQLMESKSAFFSDIAHEYPPSEILSPSRE